ncbi:ribonuclease III [Christensenellaceae bacterium OttesenSCG-928-L17]|nr:ribonuclease III [Christensenellaceae bacterium OttesenSCG-928-L17]
MENQHPLNTLQEQLQYRFRDIKLLETALTHTSYVKGDGKGDRHNERLEFLGDAVLELCVSEQLYLRQKNWSEGAMTRARANVVCEASLDEIARKQFALQNYLRLGHGEEITGGREKPSILADALEAVIGAIYVDGGVEEAFAFIRRFTDTLLANTHVQDSGRDYKTRLQEYAQKRRLGALQYHLIDTKGPDHKKEFFMQITLNNVAIGEGSGFSKQDAGQQAARQALEYLKKQPGGERADG